MLEVKTRQSRLAQAAIAGVSLVAILAAMPDKAAAQAEKQAAVAGNTEEIIVTARRREESIMKAPVVIQAISQRQIENMHVTGTTAITNVTPNLAISPGYALAGIVVNMRGLGNGGSANFVDQSVSLNIDGFSSASGPIYRLGLFDVGQIEVLKGPQSLFYGKSTSAGLIAIHSADPTKTWDSKVSVGYEFNADEMDLNGYVSGPLTDNLGIRIAGFHNTVKGWLINSNTTNPTRRVPGTDDNGARLTLKYDNPDTGLRVKLKAAYTHSYANTWSSGQNENICPNGVTSVPLLAQYSPCHIGEGTGGVGVGLPYNPNVVFNSTTNPGAWSTNEADPIVRNGVPYGISEGALAVLNVDYDIAQGVTLSSVTGLDYVKAIDVGRNPTAGVGIVDLGADSKTQEFSEELRVTTNWKDRWYNFMVGGLYNPTTRRDHLFANTPAFTFYTDDTTRLKGLTDSAFGQVLLTPVDKFELSAGVRYTHVRKHFVSLIAVANGPASIVTPAQAAISGTEQLQNVPLNMRDGSENATTPEFTLTYRPTDDLTTFVTYKKGYKAIAYNADLAAKAYTAATNISPVGGERVHGFEGGIKAQMLDHQLQLTATGYTYQYNGIQVAFTQIQTSTVVISNGANARVQGIELGGDFSPRSVEGLSLSAFAGYNDTHYTKFNQAPCWGNQTTAQGCVTPPFALPGATVARVQDLKGRTLQYAPKFSATLGATYKMDVNDKYMMAFDFHTKMQSKYYSTPELNPLGIQKAYALLDFGVRGGPQDESWELSLTCRNCTNHYYLVSASDGGPASAPAALGAIVTGIVARPREILLNLTVHPFRGD